MLVKLPVYLGYSSEHLSEPYMCAIDTSIPTVIVPNKACTKCGGKKYVDIGPDGKEVTDKKSAVYPHKMTYWEFTDGSFTVAPEED